MNSQLARNKNTLCPMKKPTGCGISLSLQDELVATIHGAFEVAVDIAVLEVTKLVSQAMGDLRDQMKGTQRENESLKQRLQRAEDKLDSVRSAMGESQNCSLKPQVTATIRTDEATQASNLCVSTTSYQSTDHTELAQNVTLSPETDKRNRCVGKKCDNGRVLNDFSDPVSKQPYCDHQPTTESNEGAAGLCIPKAESPEQPCQDTVAPHNNSSPLNGGVEMCASEPIKIKLEDLGPDCCFESMSAGGDSLFLVQSKIMEQWKPELADVHNQDPHALLPDTSLAADMTDGPLYSNDRPSLSSGFCNPFPSGEPGPAPVPQQQLPGASSRSSHSPDQPPGVPNTCKVCGQSFQLPSLLRRHHSQCQQRLRQGWRPTAAGAGVGERARFPLYAPGCSPFRCTECDRDFNRLENLKTHLRIHTGERPYVCSVCSKRFRHSGALTRHFRIHTGEKPYVCGQCGKTFRNCGGLKFHQRSHSRQ